MGKQQQPDKKPQWLPFAAILMTFMFFGISENIKGPALPLIQTDLQITEWQVGLLLSINSLGFLISCLFAAPLIRKIEAKAVLILSLLGMTLGGVAIYLSKSYAAFSFAYFAMYLTNGTLEIVLSILAARMFTTNTAIMMGISHFCYGLGSTIAPLCASFLMGKSVGGHPLGWQGMYLIMLGLGVVPIVLSAFIRFPKAEDTPEKELSMRECAKQPMLWFLAAIIMMGVVAEMTAGSWMVNLAQKAYGLTHIASAGLLSAFFFLFMMARLLLGPVIEKVGYTKSLIIFAAFSGVCSILGLLGGSKLLLLLPLAGIGIAPIYPTVMAFIPKLYPGRSDGAVNFIIIVWAIGSTMGNFLIGAMTDSLVRNLGITLGLKMGYLTVGVSSMLCVLFGIALYRHFEKHRTMV